MAIKDTKNALKAYQEKRKAGEVQILSPVEKSRQNPKSLRFAINAKCYDCCCDQKREVTRCVMTDCSLWPLRPWQNAEINTKILSGEIS